MDIKLSDVPTWLLGVGVFAIGIAAIWVFVLPGRGIEWGGSYYGPYRLADSIEKLKPFAEALDYIDWEQDKTKPTYNWVCIKYKSIPNRYCFEQNGQFSSNGNQGHWSLVH